jgi:hypothetical protein
MYFKSLGIRVIHQDNFERLKMHFENSDDTSEQIYGPPIYFYSNKQVP